MQKRAFGSTPARVSPIGIGGLHFGVFVDQRATNKIIHQALDHGINFIETAPMYGRGNSESFIGSAIQDRREKVFLSTKVGLRPNIDAKGAFGVSVVPLTEDNIRSSLETSLRSLKTEYIDLFQLHAFDPATPIYETLDVLDRLVRDGKIRFVGVSNYEDHQFGLINTAAEAYENVSLASFQVHYNLIERRAEQEIAKTCHRYNIAMVVNRALARGILAGRYKPNQPIPHDSRAATSERVKKWLDEITLHLVEALKQFAEQQGRSVVELAIAWLLSREPLAFVLLGVRNLEQLTECAKAADWIITKDEFVEIDHIIKEFDMMPQVTGSPEVFFEK